MRDYRCHHYGELIAPLPRGEIKSDVTTWHLRIQSGTALEPISGTTPSGFSCEAHPTPPYLFDCPPPTSRDPSSNRSSKKRLHACSQTVP